MSRKGLWTTQRDGRAATIRAIRNDIIVKLSKNKLGFGDLSNGDIAEVMGTSQPSVTRILRNGKNVSKPVSTS
jgi:hypothetical protein